MNRYLDGPFAPVTEEITAFDLPVIGHIPAELNGRYLRNGPNPLNLEDPETHHWFAGQGMVHGVRLRDGRAEWYRNRWIRSRDVAEKLGEEWPGGPLHEDMDWGPNTHVIGHTGRTFALVEAGVRPYELGYELDTIGACDFDGTLPGGLAAHTKLDPVTGELHAIAYFFGWEHVQHVVIDATGRVSRTTNIPVDDRPMMHDFALTEKHVVIYDLPITLGMDSGRLPYAWNPDHPARVGVLPRAGGDVRWFEIEPCWVFHTLNAYEERDVITVDLVRYAEFDVGALSGAPPTLDRWTIDLADGKVRTDRLDDRPLEFPRVNDTLAASRHRYGYSVLSADLTGALLTGGDEFPDEAFTNGLIKHDLVRGTSEVHAFARDAAVGEAVFAPAGTSEDDGYAMAYVHDPGRGATDLVILSAEDFTGPPVARVQLPARVPLGFHGGWIPDS